MNERYCDDPDCRQQLVPLDDDNELAVHPRAPDSDFGSRIERSTWVIRSGASTEAATAHVATSERNQGLRGSHRKEVTRESGWDPGRRSPEGGRRRIGVLFETTTRNTAWSTSRVQMLLGFRLPQQLDHYRGPGQRFYSRLSGPLARGRERRRLIVGVSRTSTRGTTPDQGYADHCPEGFPGVRTLQHENAKEQLRRHIHSSPGAAESALYRPVMARQWHGRGPI